MVLKGGSIRESLSYSSYFLIVCILIIIPIFLYISVSDYTVLENNFKENYYQLQNNTENSIIESIELANTGLEIYDETFDYRLKYAFIPFIEAYNSSDGKPENIDLDLLKQNLGEDYDFYIIDSGHVVRYSTKELDIGLNFSNNVEFSDHLDKILLSGEYAGDRIVRGIRDTKNVSKYGYFPSPDKKYILEISYNIKDYKDKRDLLQFRKAADSLKEMNPYLTSIKIYDIYGYAIGEPDLLENEKDADILKHVTEQKTDYRIFDEDTNTITRYRYCDLHNPSLGSDLSVVLAFTYSNKAIEEELNKILFSKIIAFFLVIILLMGVFYVATDYLTRPIKNLVFDLDEIAKGNLDHKIKPGGAKEFASLRQSIQNMVISLKSMIENLRESEKTIKQYNEELESIVQERTEELKEATKEANFYIDLMTHDINNANMATLGYAQLIEDTADDTTKELAVKMIASVKRSTEIISNVSLIRTIQSRNQKLKPVLIDEIVRKLIELNPETDILYENSNRFVLADELLTEVFSNIIDNSIKYAGDDCRIEISTEEEEDWVRVCFDDNGPGISDEFKDEIFNRLFREKKKTGKSGKGLGLYIVKSLIQKRYGGIVYADDRIKGRPDMGLRVCVKLKKV